MKAKVNGKKEFVVEDVGALDIIKIKSGEYHLIQNNKSYKVDLITRDDAEKSFVISVNGKKYTVSLKDKYDELLEKLGLDNLKSAKVNELKAPMPGLVLDIRVSEGSEVKKGDAVVVLEAMKMENILKSPTDGVIKKINIKKGVAVEKNQILIQFS